MTARSLLTSGASGHPEKPSRIGLVVATNSIADVSHRTSNTGVSMRKTRRDFLRMAGPTCVISALAGAGGACLLNSGRGRDHYPIPRFVSLSPVGMPIPAAAEPAPDSHLVRRIKAISNVFEVGRPEPNYAYVEDLGDGRGYTVTQYGFCTYNTEVTRVIERYARFVPNTDLKRFLPRLPPLATGSANALSEFPAVARGNQGRCKRSRRRVRCARRPALPSSCAENCSRSWYAVAHQ